MNKFSIPLLLLLALGTLLTSSWIRPYVMPGDHQKFREEFNEFDYANWATKAYHFDGTASMMTPEALSFIHSKLKLTVDINKDTTDSLAKPYTGGGLFTKEFYRHGTFTSRSKHDIKSGTVSSYFLNASINDGPKNEYYEIAIKFLGKDDGQAQFAMQYYQNGEKVTVQDTYNLGFNFRREFHEYTIRWEEHSISFYVDNRLAKKYEVTIPQSLQVGIDHWAIDEMEKGKWAGGMNPRSLPSSVYYDWIDYRQQ